MKQQMQTFPKGGMENLFPCFRTLSLLCCIFCISSTEEIHTLSKVVGSSAELRCNNKSLDTLRQVTWKRNEKPLMSFEPLSAIYQYAEALTLKINMSVSENELYALIIESVQMEHEGNYTCETNLLSGPLEEKWKLIVTENEPAGKLDMDMRIMIPVICTCSLVFMVLILVILQRVCKKSPENNNQSPIAEEKTEDIYENCLEMNARQRHIYNQPLQYSTMVH